MYFVIVSPTDHPLYECDLSPTPRPGETLTQLQQFIVHASLDLVDEQMWTTNSMYLKTVDKFNEYWVSTWVCATGARLCLLHETKNDDGIKSFFTEAYEAFVKILLNPFYSYLTNETIKNKVFDARIRQSARKFLFSS